MATWNKKVSPASQPNSSVSKKDAAVARINAAIANENAKIEKLYVSIGKNTLRAMPQTTRRRSVRK